MKAVIVVVQGAAVCSQTVVRTSRNRNRKGRRKGTLKRIQSTSRCG